MVATLDMPVFNGEMCIIDQTGDTKVIWDSRNAPEVEAARATFNALKAKGYIAYSVEKNGDPGKVVTEFDHTLEKIILSPPLVGG